MASIRGCTHIAHIQKLKLVGWAEEGWTGDQVDLKTSEIKGWEGLTV